MEKDNKPEEREKEREEERESSLHVVFWRLFYIVPDMQNAPDGRQRESRVLLNGTVTLIQAGLQKAFTFLSIYKKVRDNV